MPSSTGMISNVHISTWATQLWSTCGPSLSLLSELGICITVHTNFKSIQPRSMVREVRVGVPLPALLLYFSHGYWCQMSIGSLVMQPLLVVLIAKWSWLPQMQNMPSLGSLRSRKGGNFQTAPGRRWHLSQSQLGKRSATVTRHATAFTGESTGVHRSPDDSAIGWLSLAFNGNKTS